VILNELFEDVGRFHLSWETEFEVILPVVLNITVVNITFQFIYAG